MRLSFVSAALGPCTFTCGDPKVNQVMYPETSWEGILADQFLRSVQLSQCSLIIENSDRKVSVHSTVDGASLKPAGPQDDVTL